jgi:predicted nuclease of predicted toxin-antitoxin system
VKLLFDHNLSLRLVNRLADLFPNASHTSLVGLERATDMAVWSYAQVHDFTIVTKDSDFNDLSVLRGFPPKVILLRLGNCRTGDMEDALRRNHATIVDFANNPTAGVLELL